MVGKLFGLELPEISMGAEVIFHIGPLPITNTILTTWLTMALLITVAILIRKRLSLLPDTFQSIVEIIVETLYNLVTGVAGEKLGRKIFPLIATLFIFILTANWMGLLPGFASIYREMEHHGEIIKVPLLRPANSDLNTTLAMALITVILVQVAGIAYRGIKGYLKEFITPTMLAPLMAPIHLISELSHILSLSARLFGNIFGGDVVLMVIFYMLPVLAPAVFMILESLFGFIQAVIFSVLSLIYFTMAAAEEAEH
ncbi:MAG: ATP synthase F0 subunit A [Chloroflexi bacterium]|nr:MAG: ATP synthase F0 subunit A [Chloroflexota bacterium]HDN80570.1 ATP synthase F0 subunit A [Chloroflexota bacterium]